jgi:hypothetical protein
MRYSIWVGQLWLSLYAVAEIPPYPVSFFFFLKKKEFTQHIRPTKLEPQFCGLQHIFNVSAKGLKMLAVCSIATSDSNPDTHGNVPVICSHIQASGKQTPNGRTIK